MISSKSVNFFKGLIMLSFVYLEVCWTE